MTTLTMMAGKTGLLAQVAQYFVNLNEKRIQQKNANKTIKELSRLSDRELWDMGLTRGDIYNVAYNLENVDELRKGRML